MRRIVAGMLLVMGVTAFLCGGCVSGCSRSHFGTGGMAVSPGEDPMDNPRYVRLLQLEEEGRVVQTCGVIAIVAAGAYLLFSLVKTRRQNPDSQSETN
jgi:hypothetical protein